MTSAADCANCGLDPRVRADVTHAGGPLTVATTEARCTAVALHGAVTSRVKRVIRPMKEARELPARAEAVRIENLRRLGPALPHPKSKPARPWRCICISAYVDDIERVDAAVELLKAHGHTKMSRSELLRIAFARLDLDALIADLSLA